MGEKPSKAMPKFRMVNVEGTLNLARQAVKAGVKRFIFISSIKVNGELTIGSRAFLEHDVPNPLDPYALSKYEAERGLLEIANSSNMEVVIIRPSLVYGPGVKGNFATMIKVVKFGFPLPFGLANNLRSFVALDNLVDLIITCISHPKAANQIFLVSDGRDISIADLVKKISDAYGVKNKKFPIPINLMKFLLKLIRRGEVADRLFGNLLVDSSKAEKLLNWKPVLSMDEQLKIMADYDNFDRYK